MVILVASRFSKVKPFRPSNSTSAAVIDIGDGKIERGQAAETLQVDKTRVGDPSLGEGETLEMSSGPFNWISPSLVILVPVLSSGPFRCH